MNFPNVHIQKVSSSKRLMAIFAVVGEHARKVDVLNVVAQVTSIGTSLSTDSAFVGPRTTLGEFDNVFIQRLVPCKTYSKGPVQNLYSDNSEHHIGTMAICNMVVQQILCWESFRTILACVSEQSRKVHILNMLPQVGFVSTDFSTNGAFECLLPSFQVADYIIVKLLVITCTEFSYCIFLLWIFETCMFRKFLVVNISLQYLHG